MPPAPPFPPVVRRAAEAIVALAAVALLLAAARCDVRWLERHVTLSYLTPRASYAWKLAILRAVAAVLGLALLGRGRTLLGRWAARHPPRALLALLGRGAAVVLLLAVAFEGMLRIVDVGVQRIRRAYPRLELQLGGPDARYGWKLHPGHSEVVRHGHGAVRYDIDADGNRAARKGARADRAAPTIVLVGESVVFGHGLPWEQTFAASLQRDLGVQVVNLAVSGYAVDQAYLRLIDALPGLERPLAVVTLLLPALLDRTVRDFRPHLVLDGRGGLALLPPATGVLETLRLRRYLRNVVPYHTDRAIAEELDLVGAIFADTAALARRRGAAPIFFMPSPGPARPLADHPEAWIVHDLFAPRGLDCLLVDLDPAWILPGDGHPDARGARAMADALERALLREVPALRHD